MKTIAHHTRSLATLVLFVLLAHAPAATLAQRRARPAPAPPPTAQRAATAQALNIAYEIAMPRPVTRLFEVTMTVSNINAPAIEVQFPAWVPGAYRIVDAARNVQEFRAVTAGGQQLVARKTNTRAWRIETQGNSAVRLSYKVYADQFGVSGMHMDDTHAYFNGPLVFPYVVGAQERPVTLTINKPTQWRTISTGLEPVAGRANTFSAPDYDTFVDAPVEIGNQEVLRFTYRDVPYEIAIYGNHNYDTARMQREIEAIVRSQVDMFDETPFRRYVFIYHMTPGGGGGLEHLNSTVIGMRKYAGETEAGWDWFRSVTSHEFFHLWNVKRIRPEPLGPFDYTQQVTTPYLYVSEGMTSYYGDLHLRRSEVWNSERYYRHLAQTIQTLQNLPGRHILSVEEASINTWFNPDNARNVSFSYYTKGELIGLLLDLEIRQRTNNQRSLDDVFRYLNQNFALPRAGWPAGGFQRAVETVAGSNFNEFFARYVSGTEELPYEQMLGYVGLRLERRDTAAGGVGIGVSFTEAPVSPVGLTITGVFSDGPAFGVLAQNDILLAIGGERVTQQTLPILLAKYRDGERVPMTIFRGDRLLEVSLTKAARPAYTYTITEDPAATPAQAALRNSWLTGQR